MGGGGVISWAALKCAAPANAQLTRASQIFKRNDDCKTYATGGNAHWHEASRFEYNNTVY